MSHRKHPAHFQEPTQTQDFECMHIPDIGNVIIAPALTRGGQPTPLTGNVEPEHCAHAGATWSACFDLRCPHCGVRLFVPPVLLAYLADDTAATLHRLWTVAGCPEWWEGAWNITPGYWQMFKVPPFDELADGLPVLNGRVE